jgi:hypothetical protein
MALPSPDTAVDLLFVMLDNAKHTKKFFSCFMTASGAPTVSFPPKKRAKNAEKKDL